MSRRTKAYLAAFTHSILIGFSVLFIKLALTASAPLTLLAHRFTIAFGVALIPVILRKATVNIRLKDLSPILSLAIFYPVLYFLLQAVGLLTLPSAEAGIIQALMPIFTMLLATIFLREKVTPLQMFFAAMSIGGVIFVMLMKGVRAEAFEISGTIIFIGACLSYASYNVAARKKSKNFPTYALTVVMLGIGFVAFNAAAVVFHAVNRNLDEFFLPFKSLTFTVSVLYLGICASLMTSFLSNFALTEIEASKMSVFINLTVVVTMAAGAIFLGETLHWYHFVGAVIIITGVLGVNYAGSKLKERRENQSADNET